MCCYFSSSHSFAYTITVARQIIITVIVEPQLLSSNTAHYHIRLTEFLLTALSCLLYANENRLMNDLEVECSWLSLLEIYVNVNVLFVLLFFVYSVYVCSCNVVVVFLFTCLSLFILVFVGIFLLK